MKLNHFTGQPQNNHLVIATFSTTIDRIKIGELELEIMLVTF